MERRSGIEAIKFDVAIGSAGSTYRNQVQVRNFKLKTSISEETSKNKDIYNIRFIVLLGKIPKIMRSKQLFEQLFHKL